MIKVYILFFIQIILNLRTVFNSVGAVGEHHYSLLKFAFELVSDTYAVLKQIFFLRPVILDTFNLIGYIIFRYVFLSCYMA